MSHHATQRRVNRPPSHRARRSFWLLVTLAVLAAGALTSALTADPGPITGLRVAASGLVLIASLTLATRLMVALEGARRRTRTARRSTLRGNLDARQRNSSPHT